MNRRVLAVAAALWLSGCGEPAQAPAGPAEPAAKPAAMPAARASGQATARDAGAAAAGGEAQAAAGAAPEAAGAGTGGQGADARAVEEQAVDARIDRVLGDHAPYRAAFARLQRAVAAEDAATVAAMVDYPFTATIDGRKTAIEDADAFVAQYARVVTPAVAEVVAKQRYADLAVSQRGVMFGDGQAWLNGICGDDACTAQKVKVVAIQPGAP